MIEHIIRNLDHKTSKSLALTIKTVLSDHIHFIRKMNRILILKGDNTPALNYSKKPFHQSHFRRWFESYKGTELNNSEEFNNLGERHTKLQAVAQQLSNTVKQTGEIDIDA